MNILISTLGASWEIIPETIGLTNYGKVDFYRNHPQIAQINEVRRSLDEVDEVWLIATDRKHSMLPKGKHITSIHEDMKSIREWNEQGSFVVRIRTWILQGVEDINTIEDAESFHDLVLRVVAFALTKLQGGKLFLSLACGRKTMSADMQDAAYCFGCHALLHILGDSVKIEKILSRDEASKILPLNLGKYEMNDALQGYQTPIFSNDDSIMVLPETDFLQSIRDKQNKAKYFYTSYYLSQDVAQHNFQILYTLPSYKIKELKERKFGVCFSECKKEQDYLRRLPKTDLHCHLGGVLNCEEMIEVAECYSEEIRQKMKVNKDFSNWYDRINFKQFRALDNWKQWRKKWSNELNVPDYLIAASLILKCEGDADILNQLIFGALNKESNFCGIGINAYESLGDLQGSALLQSEQAIRKTVQILLRQALRENILYLEVRCSPQNYTRGGLKAKEVVQFICEELDADNRIDKSLLLIASRHGDMSKIDDSIQLINDLKSNELFIKYFRGFDLAGDEKVRSPKEMRDKFTKIRKDCLSITIHAGETMPVDNIWEAVYELNAERIGHGLTLIKNKNLIDKFLDRRIGIEMCPSSNYQIVGYRDNYFNNNCHLLIYPLKDYLDRGLAVTVNTDNPGISRTSITNELHRAARLTEKGFSIWDIFLLIYYGFDTAFCPYAQRKEMLRQAESKIGELIKNGEI